MKNDLIESLKGKIDEKLYEEIEEYVEYLKNDLAMLIMLNKSLNEKLMKIKNHVANVQFM